MTHDDRINSVAFSRDGKWVVSGSDDNTVRVWETNTGTEISRMTHDGPVTSVAISPDSKWVVSGSKDGTARVWEVAAGTEVSRLTTHHGSVNSVAFSPDSKLVVSGSDDFTARVWTHKTDYLIATACSKVQHNFTISEWVKYFGLDTPYQITCEPKIYPNAIIPEDAQTYLNGQ